MGELLGIIAIFIAIWQLKLQREEIKRNGKVTALIHMASTIKDKIDHHERIIQSQKDKKEKWKGLANKVNLELRPLLEKLNKEIITLSNNYDLSLSASDIKALIAQNSNDER